MANKSISAKDAELLANQHITDYVNACNCQTEQDVANVLMKLASCCGVSMCVVVGTSEAVDRLQGVTDYICESMSKVSYSKNIVN